MPPGLLSSGDDIFWSHVSRVCQHIQLSYVSHGTRPRYNLVIDQGVHKRTNQTTNQTNNLKPRDPRLGYL